MLLFLKIISGILIAVILFLVISKDNKEISILLSISVMGMILVSAFSYLKPVYDFFNTLKSVGNLDPILLKILLKAVGISLLAEITMLICSDAGNQALGKSLQIAATAVILWLSLPLFEKLLVLLKTILEAI